MGSVIVQSETTVNPLTLMGYEAGVCWGAKALGDPAKDFARGVDCLQSGHMRTAEFPQVYLILDGYSARVIRELYTHIGGMPTRLQASTRYINYKDFDFIVPPSIEQNEEAYANYMAAMKNIQHSLGLLEEIGIPKEDIANLLPLGMETKVVLRTNLRNLIDMSHQRLCTRAYWEFRKLMKDIINALREYSDEWKILIDEYDVFQPKCDVCGFCTEKYSCGRQPKKTEVIKRLFKNIKEDDKVKKLLEDLIDKN